MYAVEPSLASSPPITGRDTATLADARGKRRCAAAWYGAVALVIAATLVRVAVSFALPLFPDETYYWDWSRRLASGYLDHPPAIALLIRGGTSLVGETVFGVRLLPLVAGCITALTVVLIARHLWGDRGALRAAIVLACLPVAAGGLGLATPDAPLLALYAISLYSVLRAVEQRAGSARASLWWLVAGTALGAAMASKYTAVLLPLGVLVALLSQRSLRRQLTTPGPFVATAAALAVFSPVVRWNAENDWLSFRFQLHHGLGAPSGSLWLRQLDLFGTQLGLATPILFVLMAIAIVRAIRRRDDSAHFVAGVVALVTLAFFAASAMRQPVKPNWPSLLYIPAVALVAVPVESLRWRRWFRVACGFGAAIVLLLDVQAVFPLLPVAAKDDPVARAHGWSALAARVSATADSLQRSGDGRAWLASTGYEEVSEIAFTLPRHPPVLSINLLRRENQYDLWPTFSERARIGDDLVLLVRPAEEEALIALLAPHFVSNCRGETLQRRRGEGVVTRYAVWMLEGWRGTWPADRYAQR